MYCCFLASGSPVLRAHYPLLVTGPFNTFLYSRQLCALNAQDVPEMCAKKKTYIIVP